MNLAENLKKIMEQRGISQSSLAKSLGISRASVNAWAKGSATPSLDNLKRIGELLGIAVDEIISGKTESYVYPKALDINAALDYEIIEVEGRKLYVTECDEPMTLKKILEKCYGKHWAKDVHYIILNNLFNGIVVCVGNHNKGEAEIVGKTCGYA
jgi:transcriptional regulator with XRE-family HTH domain